MSSGSCLTSKLYDKIINMPSKSHETIPLRRPTDGLWWAVAAVETQADGNQSRKRSSTSPALQRKQVRKSDKKKYVVDASELLLSLIVLQRIM
jgi:hypothetical protein